VTPGTDPRTVLNEARDFSRQGRFEEALERYVWFHQHALEYDHALSGVRLSYALAEWVELGKQFPPARDALVAAGDQKSARLRAGSWSPNLFHDAAAIYEHLGDNEKTAQLFLSLHQSDPARAARFYDRSEIGLVALGMYAICAAHIPDGVARFEAIRRNRRTMLSHADNMERRHGGGFRDSVEQRFAEEVTRLVRILGGVDRGEEVRRVRELALAESDHPADRGAALTSPPAPGG
jgi:hypothetical protein